MSLRQSISQPVSSLVPAEQYIPYIITSYNKLIVLTATICIHELNTVTVNAVLFELWG